MLPIYFKQLVPFAQLEHWRPLHDDK